MTAREITIPLAFALGRTLAFHLHRLSEKACVKTYNVIIARDNRETSELLARALQNGFRVINGECSLQIIDIGVVPTPVMYYHGCVRCSDNTLGVIVTASHNPKEYNGFKIILNGAILSGIVLKNIVDAYITSLVQDSSIYNRQMQHQVAIHNNDLWYLNNNLYIECYAQYILQQSGLKNNHIDTNVNILWDCNNGATTCVINQIVKSITSTQHTIINTAIVIDDQPDPTLRYNIKRLEDMVTTSAYDIAFGFDGDGDRLVVITKYGNALRGDELLFILAYCIKHNNPQYNSLNNVIVDIKTSPLIISLLRRVGFSVCISKTGHSFMKTMMLEKKAVIGGEVSGHFFFPLPRSDMKYIAYDDAILAACYLLHILLCNKEIFYDALALIPQAVGEYDVRIPCDRTLQQKVIAKIKMNLMAQHVAFNDIDGIKYEDDDGWWLVRSSNTEGTLVVCIEGYNNTKYTKVKEMLCKMLAEFELVYDI